MKSAPRSGAPGNAGGTRSGDADARPLLDLAPVAIGHVDVDTRALVYVNERWRALTGIDDELPIPLDIVVHVVHPDDRERLRHTFAKAIRRGDVFRAETRVVVRGKPDRFVRFECSPIVGDDDEVHSYVAAMLDVTELFEATEANRRSEQRYRRLVEDAPVGQIVAELDGRLVEVNNAFVEMMRTTREELFEREPQDLFHADELEKLARDHRRLIDGEIDFYERERRMIRGDGTVMWGSGGTRVVEEDGHRYIHSVVQDVTERREVEDALRESESRFRTLANSLPLGVFQSSVQGQLVFVNPRWSQITGVPESDAIGMGSLDMVHPDDLQRVMTARERQIRERRGFRQQVRIVTASGETKWVSVHASSAVDDHGDLTGFIGSMEDITPLVHAQEETARLAGIVESTSDMVGVADATTGRLQYLNRAALERLGYESAAVADLSTLDLYADDAKDTWTEEIVPALLSGSTWSGELSMQARDGTTVQVWQTIAAKRDEDGRMSQVSAVGRDVTEQRVFEAVLAHRATHDALTDLPNRALLLDHLELALARAGRDRKLVALVFLDIDRFKSINDTFGHDAGDALLVAVAARITEVLRPADTVARLGGDEFVVLCEEIEDEHHAVAVAQRILSLVEATPFQVANGTVDLTASAGIALSPGGDGAHPEALLRDADAAMYRAKDLGRARLELFDESMRRRAAQRLEMADELAAAIDRHEIVVHYQPCVSLATGRVMAVEALARWEHPVRGLLSPQEFIELAEDTGLIVGLGLRVLSQACNEAKGWEASLGPDAPRVHVNLSARQLTATNLAVLVRGVLEGSGLEPSRLCLEITESVLMEDAAAVIEAVRRLKQIGVLLAIDDFGTGYSSLSYLRRFPVDVLKVDQSFVDGLGPDPEDSAIVAAIVNLATTLELEAVAEGVETAEQLARLRELDCGAAQGYLFARPVPATELTPLLSTTFPV
jgi:diguanylate cyclase (GGDEF)-like protein/PAS domain S-box-containing protein